MYTYSVYTYSMRANIYIRKENEDKWDKIHDKSEWVNTLLKNSGDTSEYGKKRDIAGIEMITVLSEEISPITKTGDFKVAPETGRAYDMCEHGAGVRMCREKKCKNYQFKKGK